MQMLATTSVPETIRKIEEKFPQVQNSPLFFPSPTMIEIIKLSTVNLARLSVFRNCHEPIPTLLCSDMD